MKIITVLFLIVILITSLYTIGLKNNEEDVEEKKVLIGNIMTSSFENYTEIKYPYINMYKEEANLTNIVNNIINIGIEIYGKIMNMIIPVTMDFVTDFEFKEKDTNSFLRVTYIFLIIIAIPAIITFTYYTILIIAVITLSIKELRKDYKKKKGKRKKR